jgi:uncharacterized protein (TIGR02594 family)
MTSSTPTWLIEARLHMGQEAAPLAMSNPYILGLYALAGHPEVIADEVPWCAAYVGGTLAACGIPSTKSLLAASYRNFCEELDEPAIGAIAVLDHHVAFVDAFDSTHVWLLGGNQGKSQGKSAVTVAKYRRSSILSYRWPVRLAAPADMDAAGSRTMVKGRADQFTGGVATTVGFGLLAQAGPTATERAIEAAAAIDVDKSLSTLDHGMKTFGAFLALVQTNWLGAAIVLVGLYLIASGSLTRLWRTQDANTGRSTATSAASTKGASNAVPPAV